MAPLLVLAPRAGIRATDHGSADGGDMASTLVGIAALFPEWQRRAACVGRGPDRWFLDERGDQGFAARAICAECSVLSACLDDAVNRVEEFGIWGGCGEVERRIFRRLLPARPHGADAPEGCACEYCAELARHRGNLAALAAGHRRSGHPGDRNGPGASHGIRATFARGCRCSPCRWSASALGQRLARARIDTAAHWAAHAPEGAGWEAAKASADRAALVRLEATCEVPARACPPHGPAGHA